MPAKPRWLVAIPDAIGAEFLGNERTLSRTKLLQQFEKHPPRRGNDLGRFQALVGR